MQQKGEKLKGEVKIVRFLRFGRYTHICLIEARGWREICCLEGFWKVVERYMIVKNKVLSTFQYNSGQSH